MFGRRPRAHRRRSTYNVDVSTAFSVPNTYSILASVCSGMTKGSVSLNFVQADPTFHNKTLKPVWGKFLKQCYSE